MDNPRTIAGLRLSSSMIRFISLLLSLAAAYFLTIQSIKVELAAKADSQTMEELDKKLTNLEVIIRESMVNKEQFYRFSTGIETRLARIEMLLEERTGEKLEANR